MMFCRTCGHDNSNRATGICSNCGYDLEFQNLPRDEQRKGLRHRIDAPLELGDTSFRTHHYKRTGLVGVAMGIICVTVAAYITLSFDRAETSDDSMDIGAVEDTVQAQTPSDSLPILVGSDIVYVLNDNGTSAEPRTNLNLSLIPEGTSVAFLGSRSVPLRPLVSFIDRKRAEGAAARLNLNALCCWTDTTQTSFTKVPLFVGNPNPPDSSQAPVIFKLLFTDEWIVGRIDEFDINIPAPITGGEFNAWKYDSVLTQVSGRLSRRDLGGRPVEVTAMFAENSSLGHAVDIMQAIYPSIDSLGYRGLGLKYFVLEQ
jgi:hypothetical protein